MDLPADRMPDEWLGMFPYDGGYAADPTRRRQAEILASELSRFVPGRAADLGCGNGWFAQVAAGLGWKVAASDARARPWPDVPGVEWAVQDVRDVDLSGFGVILAVGIFYHLDLGTQLGLLGRCCGTPLVVDTHLSLDGPEQRGPYRGEARPESAASLHAAYGNDESWWPTLPSLVQMAADAGGYTAAHVVRPWYLPDRTFITFTP